MNRRNSHPGRQASTRMAKPLSSTTWRWLGGDEAASTAAARRTGASPHRPRGDPGRAILLPARAGVVWTSLCCVRPPRRFHHRPAAAPRLVLLQQSLLEGVADGLACPVVGPWRRRRDRVPKRSARGHHPIELEADDGGELRVLRCPPHRDAGTVRGRVEDVRDQQLGDELRLPRLLHLRHGGQSPRGTADPRRSAPAHAIHASAVTRSRSVAAAVPRPVEDELPAPPSSLAN